MSKSFDDILRDMAPQMERMRNAPKRPVERIPEILALVQDIWELDGHDDLRFFQLLANIFGDGDKYNVEDDTVIEKLSEYLKDNTNQ